MTFTGDWTAGSHGRIERDLRRLAELKVPRVIGIPGLRCRGTEGSRGDVVRSIAAL